MLGSGHCSLRRPQGYWYVVPRLSTQGCTQWVGKPSLAGSSVMVQRGQSEHLQLARRPRRPGDKMATYTATCLRLTDSRNAPNNVQTYIYPLTARLWQEGDG